MSIASLGSSVTGGSGVSLHGTSWSDSIPLIATAFRPVLRKWQVFFELVDSTSSLTSGTLEASASTSRASVLLWSSAKALSAESFADRAFTIATIAATTAAPAPTHAAIAAPIRAFLPGGEAMTVNRDALALMGALVLEDGRLWGNVAEPWQWRLAEWLFDPTTQPNRWESRPRGGSKTTDVAGSVLVAMLETLSAGSRSYAFAVDRDQARYIVDYAAGFVMRTPALASALTVDSYKVTARNNGSTFEVMAADAASAYGLKPAIAICDEFCQWPSTVNAKGVWTATTSAMGKVKGAKLLVASTSGDPGHWSHKVYANALKSKRWSVSDIPGPLGWVTEDFLAEERALHPESVYRRLHLNEWCAPEDRLTNIDDVRACVTHTGILEPRSDRQYVIGVDLGITNDRTVAAIMHAERLDDDGRHVVQRIVLDRLEVWSPSRANPVDLTVVEEWIALASRQYRAHVVIDPYQAVAMTQRLRSKGVGIEEFTFSQASVGRLAMALHTTVRDHRLAIPDDPELIDELVNVRLRETSPNVYRLDHDSDRHDDRAIAMALAVLHLTTNNVGSVTAYLAASQKWQEELAAGNVSTIDAREFVPGTGFSMRGYLGR